MEGWIEEMEGRLAGLRPPADTGVAALTSQPSSHRSRERYREDIAACKRYLWAGDSYEICLTNRLVTATDAPDGLVAALTAAGIVLVAGRLLLGAAESVVITGAVSWGLALAGPANTGRVIAWVGAAMFAAFAGGAPIGAALYDAHGFSAIAVATIVAPSAYL